jgi:hypothetical protein
MDKIITRRDITHIWKAKSGNDISVKCQHVISVTPSQLNVQRLTEDARKHGIKYIKNYIACAVKLRSAEKNCKHMEDRFGSRNADWLDKPIDLSHGVATQTAVANTSAAVGRQTINFGESSDRSKRRKRQKLRNTCATAELTYTT